MMDVSFLPRRLRPVAALIATAIALFAGGAAADAHIKANIKSIAEEQARSANEVLAERLKAIDYRLERIERKLDR